MRDIPINRTKLTCYDVDGTLANTGRDSVNELLQNLWRYIATAQVLRQFSGLGYGKQGALTDIFYQQAQHQTFGEYDLYQFMQKVCENAQLIDNGIVWRAFDTIEAHFDRVMREEVEYLVNVGALAGQFTWAQDDARRLVQRAKIKELLIGGIDIDMAIDLVLGEGPIALITHREARMMRSKLQFSVGIFPTGAVIGLIQRVVPERPLYYADTVQDYMNGGAASPLHCPEIDDVLGLLCERRPGSGIEELLEVEIGLDKYQTSFNYTVQHPIDRDEGRGDRIAELRAMLTAEGNLAVFQDIISKNIHRNSERGYDSKELQVLHLAWSHYISTGEMIELTHYDDVEKYLQIGRITPLLPSGCVVVGRHCQQLFGQLPTLVSQIEAPARVVVAEVLPQPPLSILFPPAVEETHIIDDPQSLNGEVGAEECKFQAGNF